MAAILLVSEGAGAHAVKRALEAEGHRVQVAGEAREGVAAASGERPDLVVLKDTAISVSWAAGAARRIKESAPPAEFLPVLVVGSAIEVGHRIQLLEIADDVFDDTQDLRELVARVAVLLRMRRRIDDLRAERAEAESRAFADAVTGLRNRVFLGERINEEWRRAARYNEPLSLLLLSIDSEVTDAVLREVGQVMVRSFRQIDVVTRYSANELAALLPNTHFAGSCTCASRLRAEIRRLDVGGLKPVASMGVAFFPGKDVSQPGDLMKMAARALERAREEGGGQICLFQHQGYLLQSE